MKFLLKLTLLLFLCCSTHLVIFAGDGHENSHDENTHTEESGPNPGKLILHHIADAYEWHIITIGETHITIPLLIIAYSNEKGLCIFPTTKLHHGQSEHNGFKIAGHGEEFEGKLVEKISSETWARPALDISITKNVLSIFFSAFLIIFIFVKISKKYQNNSGRAPSGIQNLLEPLIIFIRDDVAKAAIGEKNHERFLPFLLSVFFFILINNFLGLIPFPPPAGANVTGNIAVTLSLALFTFVITTIRGNKNYWKHIFNTPGVPWWLKLPLPLMPIVEVMGMFTKPIVLMIRLFANITAGHIVSLGFFSLIFVFGNMNIVAGYGISVLSIAFAIFLTFLEFLVAFIQAYVFTLLSAIYFGMATEEHH